MKNTLRVYLDTHPITDVFIIDLKQENHVTIIRAVRNYEELHLYVSIERICNMFVPIGHPSELVIMALNVIGRFE